MQPDFEGYQLRHATALVALVVALLVPTATVGASTLNTATAAPTPSVSAVSATPSALSSHGGTVTVNGRVRNAATCQQRLLSHQNFVVVFRQQLAPLFIDVLGSCDHRGQPHDRASYCRV